MRFDRGWSARWVRFGVVVMLILATIGAWEVVRMVRLGNPAHADIVSDHVTCYEVRSQGSNNNAVIDARALVTLRDQFFPAGVDAEARQLRLLCTPAIKIRQ